MFAGTGAIAARRRSAAGSDPYWANVVCSCPFTSDLSDLSGSAHTFTASGSAAINSGSLLLGGGTDYVSAPDNDDWYLPGDFTLDCDVNLAGAITTNTSQVVAGQRSGSTEWLGFLRDLATVTQIGFAGNTTVVAQATTLTPGSFQRLSWVRSGNTLYQFVDGALILTGSAFTDTMTNSGFSFYVGINGSGASPLVGRIQHLRLTKGVARNTSSYSAGAGPYPTS